MVWLLSTNNEDKRIKNDGVCVKLSHHHKFGHGLKITT
jgi:hypothetical protein